MATLDPDAHTTVLINTFQVKPGKTDELMAELTRATEETMRAQPGFISTNLHVSEDGRRVVNYAQWRSKADLEAMRRNPEAQKHFATATELAESVDPVLYELRYSENA